MGIKMGGGSLWVSERGRNVVRRVGIRIEMSNRMGEEDGIIRMGLNGILILGRG